MVGTLAVAALGRKKRGLMLIMGSLVTGVALLLVSALPIFFVAVGLMVFIGLGDANRRALNQALIMEVTEDQYRGRVMGVHGIVWHLIPLGAFLLSFVAAAVGSIQWAVGGGALLLVLFGLAVGSLNPAVRSLGVVTREVPVPPGTEAARAKG